MIIGLTGGSGTGKSTVGAWFEKNGFLMIDGDKLSRELCQKGMPTLHKIIQEFGEEYLTQDGELNRKKLGNYVFSNPNALLKLNEITHFAITEEVKKRILNVKNAVIEGAEILETPIKDLCDFCMFVSCPKEIRKKRIMERDKLTEQEALRRLNAQKSDEYYRKNCKIEIINDGRTPLSKQLEDLQLV